MNATRRVDKFWQRVRVGRFEFGQLTPLQHRVDETARVVGQILVGGEIVKRPSAGFPLAGFGFFAAWKFQIVEQEFAQLLGRRKIELVPGETVDLFLKSRSALCERTRQT